MLAATALPAPRDVPARVNAAGDAGAVTSLFTGCQMDGVGHSLGRTTSAVVAGVLELPPWAGGDPPIAAAASGI